MREKTRRPQLRMQVLPHQNTVNAADGPGKLMKSMKGVIEISIKMASDYLAKNIRQTKELEYLAFLYLLVRFVPPGVTFCHGVTESH